jgi:hypothetical protein
MWKTFRNKLRFTQVLVLGFFIASSALATESVPTARTCGTHSYCDPRGECEAAVSIPCQATIYTSAEIDGQMVGMRNTVQGLQTEVNAANVAVTTSLQQFNQNAQTQIAQTVERALSVQDLDHPTQAQQQLITVIRQIVRQEIQKALQQQQ